MNFSYSIGRLAESQLEGIVVSLLKPQNDLSFPTNYRPTTLLNIDYKIIASIINARINIYLNDLIKPGQNDFIKGRHIQDNIRLLFDVIDLAQDEDIAGAVLTVDIYKGFGSLTWDFILNVISIYDFGPVITNWLKTFYTGPFCRVMNNNFVSNRFFA